MADLEERWPKDLPNPTWHDHVYGETHSPMDDEEHHKAVDALLGYISAQTQTISELTRRNEELSAANRQMRSCIAHDMEHESCHCPKH